jgi:hypothetical protein
MKSVKKGVIAFSVIAIAALLLVAAGCQKAAVTAPVGVEETATTDVAKKEEKKVAKLAKLYDIQPQPLHSVAECAQCHIGVFDRIKDAGGKHQIECVDCHKEFHVFNPKKRPYETAIPKCETCHGVFHGDGTKETPLVDCASCHTDPHAPLIIPGSALGNDACMSCHTKETKQITDNVSRHTTEVACSDCHHVKHGYIPQCNECHESHSPGFAMDDNACMSCHPVHMPAKITYSEKDTSNIICAGCHDQAYGLLQNNYTKHTDVKCSECHSVHKRIPLCSECHGMPHSKKMMHDTAKCGDCHGIAHDLPVN